MGETQSKIKKFFSVRRKNSSAPNVTDIYNLCDEIGSGSYSVVYKAIHKENNNYYAVKEIDKKLTNNEDRLNKEINILSIVKHKNIISFQDVFHTSQKIFLVTELAEGGELFDRIIERDHYSEKNAAVLVGHILSAIEYMHENHFVHRDLKPENILLKSKEDDTTIKIIDFGLATVVKNGVPLRAACGTPIYSAPEVIDAKRRGYGIEADMWSIGVIAFILLCGYPPFMQNEGESVQLLFSKIMGAKYEFNDAEWKDISDDAKDFIRQLLVVSAKDRMTAKEALQHSWIIGSNQSKINRSMMIRTNSVTLQVYKKVETPHDADSDKEDYDDDDEEGEEDNESVNTSTKDRNDSNDSEISQIEISPSSGR